MSLNLVILALVLYPLLYVLRINPIHVQWGFKKGLAPMPPELEKRAEAADRVVLFVTHLILLVTVVFLMHGSVISAYEVGLTSDNWKSALGMGAMLSLLPLGLIELLLPKVPPEVTRKELESRGPVATWCGLITLGSFSAEFWRAFCIVALVRLGLSAWLAIVISTVFFATIISLQTSIARALGAAAFGGAAGFLFVHTGSLLAPLTMSLIVGGTNLYRVRHASSSVVQHSAAVPKESTGSEVEAPVSRYSVTCPTCGASFRTSQVLREKGGFHCPSCGELLEYARGQGIGSALIWYALMMVMGTLSYFFGYRGLVLILITIFGSLLMFVIGYSVLYHIRPPKVQLCLRDGDTGLRLRDVPHRGEDHQTRRN